MTNHSSSTGHVASDVDSRAVRLYLNLMKSCLLNTIYADPGKRVAVWSPRVERLMRSQSIWARSVIRVFSPFQIRNMRAKPFDPAVREDGRDWPSSAHTMIGRKRLDNIQFCAEDVLARDIPGDFVETGVWRGGAVILMRAILQARGITDRVVWAADSFAGLPSPDASKHAADAGSKWHTYADLAVSLEEVQENFRRYGLLDDQVRFLKGWFRDTLPSAPIERIAVLRLDGDMYESTVNALVHLYPKLSVGGYLIVDDYAIEACRKAVDDYRERHRIDAVPQTIDWGSVFWRKENLDQAPEC